MNTSIITSGWIEQATVWVLSQQIYTQLAVKCGVKITEIHKMGKMLKLNDSFNCLEAPKTMGVGVG